MPARFNPLDRTHPQHLERLVIQLPAIVLAHGTIPARSQEQSQLT
jgi:hypothetical protein